MFVLLDDQKNSVINRLTAKSTWDDMILYHEGPFNVKESMVIDLKLCYNTFKFKEGEALTQTFTKYKALMNELVNDGIKLSKLEINTGFINGLPKKWLTDDTKVSIYLVKDHGFLKPEGFIFQIMITGRILPSDELQSKSTFKAETLKGVIINESSSAPARGDFSKKSSPYTPEQNGVAERKSRTLIEAIRTMLSGSVFSKQYWTKAVATACYTQNKSTIVKRHLKTPYEIFRKKIPNINFLHVFGCLVYIYNHKDHLGKFDEKADDGYLLGYSLVSKAFRVFNIRRQQIEETYHITFDESPNAIKFSKPLVDDINIAKTKRYPHD
ncbi:retrovirus-related pol polyprotein from transposon TNT 1-94 [Tanacetum coccineum]